MQLNQISATSLRAPCFLLLRVLTIGVGLYALLFLFSDLVGSPHFHAKIAQHPVFWAMHLAGGGIALLLCTFVVSNCIRRSNLSLHRWLGRLYVTAVICAAIAGLKLSFDTDAGLPSGVGLATLSICWLIATLKGLQHALAGQIIQHQVWIMRSFALTISAVFFRLDLGLMMLSVDAQYQAIYATVSWHSWVCTLIVVEWGFISRQTQQTKTLQTQNRPLMNTTMPGTIT